ncbi:MAG: hypothetical protein HYX50_03010 [Chloroflexi bacterium]|nr:hypothetical protein [Chloroflexota bacterium]
MVVIFGLSSIPNEVTNAAPTTVPFDKIAHFAEYAVLAFLIAGTAARAVGRVRVPGARQTASRRWVPRCATRLPAGVWGPFAILYA